MVEILMECQVGFRNLVVERDDIGHGGWYHSGTMLNLYENKREGGVQVELHRFKQVECLSLDTRQHYI